MIYYNTIRCTTTLYDILHHYMICYNIIWYTTRLYDILQHCMLFYNIMWFTTKLLKPSSDHKICLTVRKSNILQCHEYFLDYLDTIIFYYAHTEIWFGKLCTLKGVEGAGYWIRPLSIGGPENEVLKEIL